MFNKHVIKDLSAYCNGELPDKESQKVAEHLLQCERCRAQYDEIKLGVQLAERLPQVTAPSEMWSEIEALLSEQSRKPARRREPTRFGFIPGWYPVAAFSAILIVIVTAGVIRYRMSYGPNATWAVDVSMGTVKVGRQQIKESGRLAIGESLETDGSSRAKIDVADIGYVEIDHNTRVSLVETRPTEHRLSLERGRLEATIYAPPRLFFVNTPSAVAIDLGCAYTLEVDDKGGSLLRVTSGWVELVRDGRESFVPIGAMCETRKDVGPGTPYFEDATDALKEALTRFDFDEGGQAALDVVLKESRDRDTFTLWHLLSRVEGKQRVEVLDRMLELVELPRGVTRDGMLNLDSDMLELFKEEMDIIWF